MANKPLDKGYLLTQFKNFFDKKIKGAFVPSENLTSTTTVVAKDLDVTATEGSVDLVGPRVKANGSDILTENLFPHNLLAGYLFDNPNPNAWGLYETLDKRLDSGANYLVPYVYGSFNKVPSSGYYEYRLTLYEGFIPPYTGTFYLGMFKNDGDSTYVAARRYIDVTLTDKTNNTSVVVMSRNSDYDKFGVEISLTQGHKYYIGLRIYNGFNVPSNNRFYVYPSLYTHTVDNFNYKTFYSSLTSTQLLPMDEGYRGINQLTDLYDMIITLHKKAANVAAQSSQDVYISSNPSTQTSTIGNLYVTRESSWLRFRSTTEDVIQQVSITYGADDDECQLVFLFAVGWSTIRFRLLDYYGGSGSRIVAYDGNVDQTWNTLSDKQMGWQLMYSNEDSNYESMGFKLQLYSVNGREITKNNSTDGLTVTVTQVGR